MINISVVFLRSFILFSVLAVSLVRVVFSFAFPTVSLSYFWPTNLVLLFGTLLSAWFTENAIQEKGQSFVQLALLTTAIRLTLYAVYTFIIIYISQAQIKQDIIYFAVMYFMVTIFDIVFVLRRKAKQ